MTRIRQEKQNLKKLYDSQKVSFRTPYVCLSEHVRMLSTPPVFSVLERQIYLWIPCNQAQVLRPFKYKSKQRYFFQNETLKQQPMKNVLPTDTLVIPNAKNVLLAQLYECYLLPQFLLDSKGKYISRFLMTRQRF